jgi:DNA-binding NarL/FixJ family response regulator
MLLVPTRVFLIDDHEIVRRGVRELLEADGDLQIVGEAGTCSEALDRLLLVTSDVAVVDVQLPDGNGVELCREIRSRHPETACVILTSFADDEALLEAILAGASGYLLKQVRGTEIVEGVRTVGAGGTLFDPAAADRARERLRRAAEGDERLRHLTAQERRILAHLAAGRTNRQIAAEMFLAEKTVKNYVSNLLAKLGMAHRTEAALYAARLDLSES